MPIPFCRVGGENTFKPTIVDKSHHDRIQSDFMEKKIEFNLASGALRKNKLKALVEVEKEKKALKVRRNGNF